MANKLRALAALQEEIRHQHPHQGVYKCLELQRQGISPLTGFCKKLYLPGTPVFTHTHMHEHARIYSLIV